MTQPPLQTPANIVAAMVCVAVISVTGVAAQSSERDARLFLSRVRAASTSTGIVLNQQDVAVLIAHVGTAQIVEVEWTGEPGRVTSVRMSAVLDRAQFEIARRLRIQPASARHLIVSGDSKRIARWIERALVEEIRNSLAGGPSTPWD